MMREFLEDAHAHRDDGYGRAQKHMQRELPKKFYTEVSHSEVEEGYAILLDGRATKTPSGKPIAVPTEKLAKLVIAEWQAQEDKIDPDTMPVVRLINSAVEGGQDVVPALRDEIINFAGSDLLLYRADTPRELVEAQEAAWDKVLVSLARKFNVKFQPAVGIIHQQQPDETLAKLKSSLVDAELFELTALVSITGLTGSGLLAIALRTNLVSADEAWNAAHVDEDYNVRLWGEDDEAVERRKGRRTEFEAALQVISALR